MYESIEKYAEKYRIPKRYAYGIAYKETRYEGPFHWNYNHRKTSPVGALGPMQIMPGTAKFMWGGKRISDKKLMEDIDFNVHTSMKLLRYLYDKYGDWKIVFGCYNTGSPLVNQYALDVYDFNFQPNGYKLK
jgi:soluble lytic murein transglycosylase-like protein